MSELKDKETEQVVGGTFIPTFVPEYEEKVNIIRDEIPNVDISKYRLVDSDIRL